MADKIEFPVVTIGQSFRCSYINLTKYGESQTIVVALATILCNSSTSSILMTYILPSSCARGGGRPGFEARFLLPGSRKKRPGKRGYSVYL